MKLQFDSSQEYQLQAVRALTNIFEGQPLAKGDLELSFGMEGASIAFTENGVGNNLVLTPEQLLKNVQSIQTKHSITESDNLVSSVSDN